MVSRVTSLLLSWLVRADIPRILGIVCRGGEGGVKGLDSGAAAQPPLTPPAPRLCSVYPGNVGWVCPVQDPSKTNFVLTKSKTSFAQFVIIGYPCAPMHTCAPFVPLCSDACLRDMKNHRYQWGRHNSRFDSLWVQGVCEPCSIPLILSAYSSGC